jgi:hypothetical protein
MKKKKKKQTRLGTEATSKQTANNSKQAVNKKQTTANKQRAATHPGGGRFSALSHPLRMHTR